MLKKNKKRNKSNKKTAFYNYIWTKENPISYITESYQKIIANLEYVNVDKKYQVLQICSSVSSEGKTTFLSNLAYLLSKKGKKTILIDLDLRKPKVHKIYDVDNTKGITEILTERVELKDAIKRKKENGFDVITSGEKTTAIINLLESNKMKELIEKLRKEYDYILLDSPPIINVSDALYISKLSDSIIFVVSLNQTKRGLIKEAINLLKQNNCNLLGIVVNQVDIKKTRYGYGYGYGYGYDYSYDTEND
jgi:protein-tyrosine kinase